MKLLILILWLCLYNIIISQEWEEFPLLPIEEFPNLESPEEGTAGEGETEELGGGEEEFPTGPPEPLYPIFDEDFQNYLSTNNFQDADVQEVLNFAVTDISTNDLTLPAGNYKPYELHYGFRAYEGVGDIKYWDTLFEFSNCEGVSVLAFAYLSLNPYTGVASWGGGSPWEGSQESTIIYEVSFLPHGPIADSCPPNPDPTYVNLMGIVETDTELQELIDFGVANVESSRNVCLSGKNRKIYAANSRVIDGQTVYQFNIGYIDYGSTISRTAFDVIYNSANEKEVTSYRYNLIYDDVSGHAIFEGHPTCYE